MANLQLIKEQIQFAFTESNCIENELIGLTFDNFGRLTIDEYLNIYLSFNINHNIDFEYIEMFFKPRLNFPGTALYIKKNSISLFKKPDKIAMNDFEKSMQKAKIFNETAKTIKSFLSYLNNSK